MRMVDRAVERGELAKRPDPVAVPAGFADRLAGPLTAALRELA
ncbi:hypothetical protein ACPZ19_20815 [Amycolatopsis lurida]